MSDNILIIEHDLTIAEFLIEHMQDIGVKVTHCSSYQDGLEMAISQSFSLLVLGFNMPSCVGLDICQKIKAVNKEQAILMVTFQVPELQQLLCLELGADDYIADPFNVRELQARVKALLRRVHLLKEIKSETVVSENDAICHGQLLINKETHEVILRDQNLVLTSTEFNLLSFMAEKPDHVFSRAELLDKVWGYQHSGYEQTVSTHINRLRNKLVAGQPNSLNKVFPDIIQTVFGVGYKFSLAGVA